MKLKKPLIITGIIVILVAIVGGYFIFSGPKKVEMITAVVSRGTLIQTVEATGTLESFDKVDLSFGSSGEVANVMVEVGDEVQVGDLLAELDLSKAQANLSSAEQAVAIARANLALKEAGSTTEAIAVSESQVAAAEAVLSAAESALTSAQLTTAAAVTTAETNLANAENDLANDQIDNEEKLTEVYADLFLVLKNNAIEVREALSKADEVLGVNNSLANDAFQDVLSANDSQALTSAKKSYNLAVDYRNEVENLIIDLDSNSDSVDLTAAADKMTEVLSETSNTLLYTRQALDATNVDNADFSSDDLSVLKTSIDTARASVQTEEEALNSQTQIISQLIISNDIEISTAEDLVTKYENALTSAKAEAAASLVSAEATVAMRQADVAQAEAGSAQVKAGPRAVDLASFEAALAQAEANYRQIESVTNDSRIFAPIAGQVTSVEAKRGEEVTATAPIIVVQSATTRYQIAVDISESDISKVTVGDKTEVTFDAFGEDKKFIGQVAKIDPAEKSIDGVIYYEAKIYLDENSQAADWKPGMTANVTITTIKKDNVLLVSQRAVLEHTDGSKYVRFPDGDSFKEQTVEIGVRGDGGLSEALSGVEEGQTVIVSLR